MGALSLYQFKELIATQGDQALLILDVRSETEHQLKKIEDSYNIPLAELPARLDELSGYETIVVYCNEGHRSERAFHLLESLDIHKVFYVAGSSKEWESTGLPVIVTA